MAYLPQEPIVLLSYVNTKLRDGFESLDEFCEHYDCSKDELVERLRAIGYTYRPELNQFR